MVRLRQPLRFCQYIQGGKAMTTERDAAEVVAKQELDAITPPNEELLRTAKRNPAPQEWYDEKPPAEGDVAAEKIADSVLPSDTGGTLQEDIPFIKAILDEAYAEQTDELRRLRAFKAEIDEAVKGSMDERCDAYERHCTCVAVLRNEVRRLRAMIRRLSLTDFTTDEWDEAMDAIGEEVEADEAAGGKA